MYAMRPEGEDVLQINSNTAPKVHTRRTIQIAVTAEFTKQTNLNLLGPGKAMNKMRVYSQSNPNLLIFIYFSPSIVPHLTVIIDN